MVRLTLPILTGFSIIGRTIFSATSMIFHKLMPVSYPILSKTAASTSVAQAAGAGINPAGSFFNRGDAIGNGKRKIVVAVETDADLQRRAQRRDPLLDRIGHERAGGVGN